VILFRDEGSSKKKQYLNNPYTQELKRVNEDGSTGGGVDNEDPSHKRSKS